MTRKGISPVISIVLILMMTVAIAGVAYVWITNMMEDKQDDTDDILNTKIDVLDLSCGSDFTFNVTLQNSGKKDIEATTTYVYIKDVSDDSIKGRLTLNWNGKNFESPNGYDEITGVSVTSVVNWTSSSYYELRFEFPTANYELTKSCTVD